MSSQRAAEEVSGVFISYRRADTAGYAGRLFDSLRERLAPRPVFIDIDTIEPGADFVEVVERAVNNWGVLLALIGPRWLTVTTSDGAPRLADQEDFVRREIGTALARNVRVIPILVGGATMPPTNALPDDLKPLTRRHGLEITDARWHFDVARLVEALERHWATFAASADTTPSGSGLGDGARAVQPNSRSGPELARPSRSPLPLSEPAPGLRLGSFELVERVGRGATSDVWKAHDRNLDRVAAITIPHPMFRHDAELRGRFKHEAQAVAAINHPNIVPIWEVGEHGSLVYVASPFVETTLQDRRQAPWSPSQVLALLDALASALDLLNERGYALTSFKASDVRLAGRGTVMLDLFDISRVLSEFNPITPVGMPDTSEYHAPEQILGATGGPAANVYRLGLIAYELLTGREPFSGAAPHAVMYQHVSAPAPAPSTIVPMLPPGVDEVLLRALAKDPDARYPSAGAFVHALRQALIGGAQRSEAGRLARDVTRVPPPPAAQSAPGSSDNLRATRRDPRTRVVLGILLLIGLVLAWLVLRLIGVA